jgi:hypothetical protein
MANLDDSRSSLPPLEIQNSELEVLSSIFGVRHFLCLLPIS